MVKRHNEPILEERSIAEDQAGRELYDLNRKPLARRGTRDGGSDEPILYTSPLGGVSRPCPARREAGNDRQTQGHTLRVACFPTLFPVARIRLIS